ncbi:hypothetical protein LMG27177_03175 [Paraburkholderia fynbosensis]|uniref:Uncharacterized protein n=1 Tax=Paraburkholderia fynbosensis TaxID=1200993 RepID=A0A6J5G3M7_9BURK|nr:hypothetical protein LMG27177_03175 [Paraburkholderia fynbosensis]
MRKPPPRVSWRHDRRPALLPDEKKRRVPGRDAPFLFALSNPPASGPAERLYFFFCGGKSVQTPSYSSAAIPIDSPSVGCG